MGSLVVPSVQELVKEKVSKVPARYVRSDEADLPSVLDNQVDSFPQLPVIDMARLPTSRDVEDSSELMKMHEVSKEWGFFQLVNHGVDISLVERVKKEIDGFFNLPIEEKKNKYGIRQGDTEGFGQLFVFSEEQKLDWGDMLYMVTLPPHMRKPHLFPELPAEMREAFETYSAELKKLALKLLYCMAKALKMDPNDMKVLFDDGKQGIRMSYYPPCPQPELVMGLTAHSDATGITILLQTNDVEGLQIRKDGKWVPVRPVPNSFIVNVGDILEIVTNGVYRSIEHRVVVNPENARMSLATFYHPNENEELGPAPSLITLEHPTRFRSIGVAQYYKEYFSRKIDGKSFLDYVRI